LAITEVKYAFRTVQTIRGMEGRTKAKWARDGWEFVSEERGLVRTRITLRRVKRTPPWLVIGIAGGVVVLGIVTLVVLGAIEGAGRSHHSQPAAATTTQTPRPTQEPTDNSSPQPGTSSSTQSAILNTFRSYFAERAANGVVLAKSVTNVTFSDGIVQVTFDPNAAGIDRATFDSVNVYSNLAEFASVPVAFDDPVGNKLRPDIDGVDTVLSDGTSLGSYTRADILAMNGLSK
jgi:hypothetical protein